MHHRNGEAGKRRCFLDLLTMSGRAATAFSTLRHAISPTFQEPA